MYMYKIALVVLLVLLIILYLCSGINMNCKKCIINGSHFHLEDISRKHTNHGPKPLTGPSNDMCSDCNTKHGYIHFHLF